MYTSMLSLLILSVVHLTYGTQPLPFACFSRESCDLRIDNNCYVHVDNSVSWNEAEVCCFFWGGHLASIHSAGTNHLLNKIRNVDRFTWIGLRNTSNDGVYVWTDGTAFDYNNFSSNQSDSHGGESCFHFLNEPREELSWNDYHHCFREDWGSVSTSYICQKIIRPQMDRSRCECDITLNGKCYISMDTRASWYLAEDSCVEWGGHLASIHSDLENYAVNSIRDTRDFTWIGLSDTANDGVYVWTDGTAFDYNNFHRNQPDSGGESCFHFFDKPNGELTWNDYQCNREDWASGETSFVCKKDIDTCTTQCSPCTGISPAIKGERGEAGPQGPLGPRGHIGPFGAQGDIGHPGDIGFPGPFGRPGQVGPVGAIGNPGAKGGMGEKGERGLSVAWRREKGDSQ